MTSPSPLPTAELQQIANNACETALGSAVKYDHTKVADWNTTIINTILQTLLSATSAAAADSSSTAASDSSSVHSVSAPVYKYIVNSTIIQHHDGDPSAPVTATGRRGMHSAVGAYWNTERDGTFSSKWERGEGKGMDVVVSINWVGL